jgi:phosphoglycolate phosphatase
VIVPRNFDLIVFDWDGTLSDSTPLIAECVQLAARDLGYRIPSTQESKNVIGLGLHQSTSTLFPELSNQEQLQFATRFRERYVPRDHEAGLYIGVRELLASLDHPERMLAVATGKPRAGLQRAFLYTNIQAHFHATRCGDEGFTKPHPEMLEVLMDTLGVEPSRTLMIGDTTHDLQLAANARTHAIAVTYGAHPREALTAHRPRAVVNSVRELSEWLHENA